MKKKNQRIIKSVFLLIMACLYAFLVVKACFLSVDNYITDKLYANLGTPFDKIIIVSIEDSTMEEYGSFASFAREKTSDLIALLNSDEDNAPAVIGVDIMFAEESDTDADEKLVQAAASLGANAGMSNVVFASSNIYRDTRETDDNGNSYMHINTVVAVNEPFDALKEVADYGFTNANITKDGVVRTARIYDSYNGERVYSFDWIIFDKYLSTVEASALSEADSRYEVADKTEDALNIGFY